MANHKATGRPRGRPENSGQRLQRYEVAELIKTKRAPLDVMLRNMHFWDEAADNMQEKIADALVKIASDGADVEVLDKLEKLMKQFFGARANAQSCAVDAAPYVHARLQSIVMKPETEKNRVVTLTLPPTAAERNGVAGTSKDARAYRVGYGDPVKKQA